MRRWLLLLLALAAPVAAVAAPNPAADRAAFQGWFRHLFPQLPLAKYVDGPYNFSASERAQWQQIMELPPYGFAVDHGKALFDARFPDGAGYASCFPHGGIGIAQDYPQFDPKTGRVVTLPIAINRCRVAHGLPKLKLTTGDLADIDAYMVRTSRGHKIDVVVPDTKPALAAYEAGKEYFYSRRGQLNFSCASCHLQYPGHRVRGDTLAPALGITASFPIYRSKWGNMGTLVRRFIGCNKKTGVVPLPADSVVYRDLEYFLAYMNNGLPVAGPGARP